MTTIILVTFGLVLLANGILNELLKFGENRNFTWFFIIAGTAFIMIGLVGPNETFEIVLSSYIVVILSVTLLNKVLDWLKPKVLRLFHHII